MVGGWVGRRMKEEGGTPGGGWSYMAGGVPGVFEATLRCCQLCHRGEGGQRKSWRARPRNGKVVAELGPWKAMHRTQSPASCPGVNCSSSPHTSPRAGNFDDCSLGATFAGGQCATLHCLGTDYSQQPSEQRHLNRATCSHLPYLGVCCSRLHYLPYCNTPLTAV